MGLFDRMFGGDLPSLTAKADASFERGDFGSAKLGYEKALAKAKGAPDDVRERLAAQVRASRDGIARKRLDEAARYEETRERELALAELSGALEVAASEALVAEARARMDALERQEAVAHAAPVELGFEERAALVVGQWSEAESAEFDALGDTLLEALVALHAERFEEGRQALESLLASAESPRYLLLEVGRARLLTGDTEGGEAALRDFLEALGPEEGGETRLGAHFDLARLLDERGDTEGAMAELERAVEVSPTDPRAYLQMGAYLRRAGHPEEALEVLETAVEVMGTERPHWGVLQEVGLAQAEAGRTAEAVATLEGVLKLFTGRGETDFPPATARALAELHASAGRLERAADLYRSLAAGSDRGGHLAYHLRAGELLEQLGLGEEARRMLTRALALAAGHPELEATIRGRLAGEGPG